MSRLTASARLRAVATERGVVIPAPRPKPSAALSTPLPSALPQAADAKPQRFIHQAADAATVAWNQQRERDWHGAQEAAKRRRSGCPTVDPDTIAWNQRREVDWHASIAAVEAILRELAPSVFNGQPVPLKIGIYYDINSLLAGEFDEPTIRRFLKMWVWRPAYRDAIAHGGPRFDLDGQPAGVVTEAEQGRPTDAIRKAIDCDVVRADGAGSGH